MVHSFLGQVLHVYFVSERAVRRTYAAHVCIHDGAAACMLLMHEHSSLVPIHDVTLCFYFYFSSLIFCRVTRIEFSLSLFLHRAVFFSLRLLPRIANLDIDLLSGAAKAARLLATSPISQFLVLLVSSISPWPLPCHPPLITPRLEPLHPATIHAHHRRLLQQYCVVTSSSPASGSRGG